MKLIIPISQLVAPYSANTNLNKLATMVMHQDPGKPANSVDMEKSVDHGQELSVRCMRVLFEDKIREQGLNTSDLQMSFNRIMSFIAMAFLWTGSQIPLYLLGSVPYYIYSDIGGEDRWVWFAIGNLLALASVCPFVGSMSDLLGRRNVALFGAGLIIVGTVVASTAQNMNIFIGNTSCSHVVHISPLSSLNWQTKALSFL